MKKLIYSAIVLLGLGALTAYTQEVNKKPDAAAIAIKTARISAAKTDMSASDLNAKSDVATADGDSMDNNNTTGSN